MPPPDKMKMVPSEEAEEGSEGKKKAPREANPSIPRGSRTGTGDHQLFQEDGQ